MKLCVIGYPSKYGGADTELDHQITCWHKMGVEVHVIPTSEPDSAQLSLGVAERVHTIHHPREWSACKGMHVISYCNGDFLANIIEIKKHARSTTFVNCMTWLFDKEREAHALQQIDVSLYQTDHARAIVEPELRRLNPKFRWFKVRPYFDASAFPFHENTDDSVFRFCRVSRDDPAKFSKDTFRIFRDFTSPVPKKGIVLGFKPEIFGKCGPSCGFVELLTPNHRPNTEVYAESDVLLQSCDTYENLPRVAMEAMASGCVPIVDNRGGWREIVEHDVTGLLCGSAADFIERATYLAHNPDKRRQMAIAGRQRVELLYGLESATKEWSEFFKMLEETYPEPVAPMTITEKATSFIAVTGATVVSRLLGRGGLLSEEKIQERLDICQSCDLLGADGRCSACGCSCDNRAAWINKLAHPASHCPLTPPKW